MITERPAHGRPPGPADPAAPHAVPVPVVGRAIRRRDIAGVLRAYLSLTKPRIVELLLVTTVPTMFLAAGGLPDLALVAIVLVGGSLAAGAASALNCYLDRDIDGLMRRTKRRALPAHSVTPRAALIFGLTLAAVSVVLMAATTNLLATLLTAAAIGYYDLVYTMWLKRSTSQNTFWGGICGAAPVLIGWAAVTGSLGPGAWALFAVVFFWQMPHFYALAIKYKDDYARAGIPMLPVVATPARVNREIIIFTALTLGSSLVAWPLGLGWIYGVVALGSGGLFLMEAVRLVGRSRRAVALRPMRLFHASVAYLTVLFLAVAVQALV
jgi:protoheme IX farnesyltransferase